MEYVCDMPRFMDDMFLAEMLAGCVSIDPQSTIEKLIFTKSNDYKYEQEWRIYSGAGRDAQANYEYIPFNALELDAVIFGCRTAAEDREKIKQLISERYPHAKLLQAQKAQREFRLEIKEIVDC